MSRRVTRRQLLKLVGGTTAARLLQPALGAITVELAAPAMDVLISPVSRQAIRITLAPRGTRLAELAHRLAKDGAVVLPHAFPPRTPGANALRVRKPEPLTYRIETPSGEFIQQLRIDPQTSALRFALGKGAVLGLGEGGPQFDRRGNYDPMRSGQGGYHLRTHGGRVPIQWLLGTAGWGLFIHQPLGTFDLTGDEGVFAPHDGIALLPLDLFVVDARDPEQAMAEYSRITGRPEMPPLWSLGYQQSHRTLANWDEVLSVAHTFRDKKLPCDTLIYLGTGFTPSGWNTANGSFQFNPAVFSDPLRQIHELHALNFRVVLHSVILTRALRGTVHHPCPVERFDAEQASCLWDAHRKDFALGIDGWWPDEGDPLDAASRLRRHQMYYEGAQLDRPKQRPYALHRNGYAGMQRYAGFLWSGDVYSTWETLRTHVSIGINAGLSGIPLWGTDTGGFVPTKEFTGELYVRWFQFSAFCPLFRSHGRTWKLRLPWGWDTGELGPNEVSGYGDAANPDTSELHNSTVEPICRKYLELRYRLLPYLCTAVRETHETGLPIIRALWLHYPKDKVATTRGDEYLFGRDLLVAPVTERGATSREVYLPQGNWYDFWTEEKLSGGREIMRSVDLGTLPLYVRAGAILPFAPLRHYTAEKTNAPTTLVIYSAQDAAYTLYEDDGISFNYRRGQWIKTEFRWDGSNRRFSVRLAPGSKMLPRARRKMQVRLAGSQTMRTLVFSGQPLEFSLS